MSATTQRVRYNQPNGVPQLDSNGDLPIDAIINFHDTADNLSSVVLAVGQLAYATDTGKIAMGDGSSTFDDLKDITVGEVIRNGNDSIQARSGGGVRGAYAVDLQQSGSFVAEADYSFIGGGHNNYVSSLSNYSLVCGGSGNAINAAGTHSAIVGGSVNLMNSGCTYSFIGGGQSNALTNGVSYSVISGGRQNLSQAQYTTISGGYNNSATTSATYSSIPGGVDAVAIGYGQVARSSGKFSTAGDAQVSSFILRNTTTDDTPTELFLDGVDKPLPLQSAGAYAMDIVVVGTTALGEKAMMFRRSCLFHVHGTTEALVGTVDTIGNDKGSEGWSVDVDVADFGDGAIKLTVTGAAATTIRWVAEVRTVEVRFI